MRGHVKQRAKGSWTIWLELPRDPVTGKRRQKTLTVKGSKREAEKKLVELEHQIDTGGFVNPAKATVAEFLRQWLRDYVSTNVRAATSEGYRIMIGCHLVPNLGAIPLSQLQPSHIQEYYAKALKMGRRDGRGGLSARTVLHHHRVLSEALSHAVKWGLVVRNVAQAVDPPRPVNHEMQSLDNDGVQRLLAAARVTMYFPLIHLAIYTGLRRSELLGLRWKDVDLDMATLSVVQVMHCLPGARIVFQEPKTAKGRRMVALSPSAVLALRAYSETVEADLSLLGIPLVGERLVFSNLNGSPLLPNSVTHAFAKIVRRAGLNGIRLHDLRHTHASLMLRQGVHPKIVSERLGHSSISITLDTYSHVLPGLQEAAALRFDEGLARSSPMARDLVR